MVSYEHIIYYTKYMVFNENIHSTIILILYYLTYYSRYFIHTRTFLS